MAAQHLRLAARQMKLASADIDPHIAVGHHQIGVAGKPEPGDIKQSGQALVGHLYVDVFEMDGVAEILGAAIEWLIHGHGPGRLSRPHISATWRTNPTIPDNRHAGLPRASGRTSSPEQSAVVCRKRQYFGVGRIGMKMA
jgi:hypothetical protein